MALQSRLSLLRAQREALEVEADAIASELRSPGPNGEPPAGIKESLVDAEGFPRADIDIFNVKQKRHRLSVINYDYSVIMKEIEALLPQILANGGNNQDDLDREASSAISATSASSSAPSTKTTTPSTTLTSPASIFRATPCMAHIDEILDGSPAQAAGLRDQDELLAFGSVRCDDANGRAAALNLIPSVVRGAVNMPIPLVVRRQGEILGSYSSSLFLIPCNSSSPHSPLAELSITPTAWGGRGLLGCHLPPV